MDNKNQHWVPRSYLNAWVDSSKPKGHEDYVWVFSKIGDTQKNKSPKNIFFESEFYTRKADDGSRDLTLEKKLSNIEGAFIKTRRKVELNQVLTSEDKGAIIVFISVMLHRTKLRRDNEKKQWEHVLAVMDDMAECIKKNPQKSYILSSNLSSHGDSMSHSDVKKIASEPIQSVLLPASRATADILKMMNMHVLCAPEGSNFITSDHPCVLFDPFNRDAPIALGNPNIEFTFPLSPKQMVIFFWGNRGEPPEYRYAQVEEDVVDDCNRRTRFFCCEYFIANDKVKKDSWFS